MESIKFYLGLISGKLASAYFSLRGNPNNDRPGILARKFDEDFMAKASKPEEVLLISGTNGKSSTTNIINSIYKLLDKKVACNEAGNNTFAGESWTLLQANNYFNKPIVDVVVMEADELYSRITFPQIKPTNLIITNLGRDSMFKNANPEVAYKSLDEALEKLIDTKVFLNADDPLSCFLGKNNKKMYYGVSNIIKDDANHISNDFIVCPKCFHKVIYEYHNYRHIGKFRCPNCDLKSPNIDYLCTKISDKEITISHQHHEYDFPLISNTIYNIYNQVAVIAYFMEMGYSPELIKSLLSKIKLPEIREEINTVNDLKIIRRAMKGQNASAASTVLKSLNESDKNKEIILMLDEIPDDSAIETISWIWDTDFEFLNNDSIKRIIVSGKRYLDHKVRLLTANVNPKILFTVEDDEQLYQYLDTINIEELYILYDIMALKRSKKVMNRIIDDLKDNKHEN